MFETTALNKQGKIIILISLILTPTLFYLNLEIPAAVSLVIGSAVLAACFPRALFIYLAVTSCISLTSIHDRRDLYTGFGGVNPNGIQLFLVIAIGLPILAFQVYREKVRIPKVLYIYFLFLALAAFSLIYAPALMPGVRLLFKLLYPVYILILYLLLEKRKQADVDWIFKLLLYTFSITLILALAVGATGITFVKPLVGGEGWLRVGETRDFYRFNSPFGPFKSVLGMMSAVICLISIHALMNKKYIPAATVSTIVAFITLVLTLSRIAFYSFSFVALIYLLVRKKWFYSASLVVLVVLIVLLTPMQSRSLQVREIAPEESAKAQEPAPKPAPVTTAPTVGSENKAQPPAPTIRFRIPTAGREFLWAVAWDALTKRPVIGNGLGSTTFLLTRAYPDNLLAHVVHNEYLRVAAETGIVGLTLMLIFFLALSVRLSAQWHRGNSTALMALAILAIYGITMITDNTLDYYRNVGFFLYLAIGMSNGKEYIDKKQTA